jgi:DNA-binding transcriptional MocR family regulator
MRWILEIQSAYLTKRDILAAFIAKHLPPGIVSYDLSKAGFFVSVGLLLGASLLIFTGLDESRLHSASVCELYDV